MKQTVLTFLTSLFVNCVSGQTTFSNVDINLKTVQSNSLTDLICSNATFSIKFQLKQKSIQLQNNVALIDSQLVQITPLKISGYKKSLSTLNTSEQKQLLDDYSEYELDFFKKQLNIEIVKPNNQWVITKSKGWLVWYFRVGNLQAPVDKKTEIQLFASTIVSGKVLTINAPILSDGNFTKAALIVNEMMESFTNNTKK